MDSPVIDIDVGGAKVRTTRSTLVQAPFLEVLLRHDAAGTMSTTKTDDGLIFIDRSPELFMKVLEGLRAEGKIFTESSSEASQIMEELAFLGLHASCPKLNAWEKSVTEQLSVSWGMDPAERDHVLILGASHSVLNEVAPVLGFGGVVMDDFHGHRLMGFKFSRHQVNPSLADNGQVRPAFAFRLAALLGEMGFAEKSHFGATNEVAGTMMFARKKLHQCEQPFIINIELSEQHNAACEGPFQIGVNVLAHSLGKADLNGALGAVVGHQGDRVIVKFSEAIGEKALKRKNLALVTSAPSDRPSTAAMNADSAEVVGQGASGGTRSLVSDRQSSMMDDRFDDTFTSVAQLADNQKSEADEPDLQEAIQQSENEALQKEQADVAQAIFESTFEPPGGIVLRLTHHDPEVRESLMTAEVLDDCRRRVTDARCELSPGWGNGALFLLPFREQAKFQELQLQGIRLEDLKPYNIVAMRDDEELVKQALAQVPRRRRPQCKHEGSGSASSITNPDKPSGATPETGELPYAAPEFLSDIRVEIVHTFYTVRDAPTSSDASKCHSAPW